MWWEATELERHYRNKGYYATYKTIIADDNRPFDMGPVTTVHWKTDFLKVLMRSIGADKLNFLCTDKALSSQRSSVESTLKMARWIGTIGLKVFLQFYYSKVPVFQLPPGWFPYYVEWLLAFPRAPLGWVSVQIWSGVCAAVIALLADMVASAAIQLKSWSAASVPKEPQSKKTL